MSVLRVCEVGPRDGLQNQTRHFSVDERIELIDRLTGTTPAAVEAVSFVNDRRVPRMAGAEEILDRIARPSGVDIAALVLNGRGVTRALECELDEIRFAVSATDSFNLRNVNAPVSATVDDFRASARAIRDRDIRLTAIIAVAFGCPFSGVVVADAVIELAGELAAAGAEEILLADTIGCGVPSQVSVLLAGVAQVAPGIPLGVHLHNTRNTGYANAVAAVSAGATTLDSSVGGLGGCPFAPNATGNIATEDLCFMLRNMGIETGVRLPALLDVVGWLGKIVPDEITGQLARAGLFPEVAGE